MPSKWEYLLDQKPMPLGDYLLIECAKLFAKELAVWPPQVENASGSAAALLASEPARPGSALLREAFRLARWDLAREHDAYDEHMRNLRWLGPGVTEADKPMLLFMSQLIEEHLLALGEATKGRVDRKAMLRVLDLTERAVLKVGEA